MKPQASGNMVTNLDGKIFNLLKEHEHSSPFDGQSCIYIYIYLEPNIGHHYVCRCLWHLMVLDYQYASYEVSWHLTPLPQDKMATISQTTISKCIFTNEKFCILFWISLKFVPKGPIDNNSALVQVMAWRQTRDKPLSEPVLSQFIEAYIWH